MTRDLEALHREIREQATQAIPYLDYNTFDEWENDINAEVAKRMYRAGVEDAAQVADFAEGWIGAWKEKYGSASVAAAIRALSLDDIGRTK